MQGPNACLGKILGEKCDVEARKEQKWREKSIQVVLITTSEKMATKKNMKEIKKIKDPLQRIFLWFCFFFF